MAERQRVALSLIEMLVALAVLMILAAILIPIFFSAVKRAKKTSCEEKLLQLHRALELYRLDHQPHASTGTPPAMGLPPNLATLRRSQGLPKEITHCQGSTTRDAGAAFTTLFMVNDELSKDWEEYIDKMGERAVIIADDNHQKNPQLQNSPFALHDAFGVTLGGSITRRSKQGHPGTYEFWIDSE